MSHPYLFSKFLGETVFKHDSLNSEKHTSITVISAGSFGEDTVWSRRDAEGSAHAVSSTAGGCDDLYPADENMESGRRLLKADG